jgi:uncharacterized protein YndB with AHSA1/START domain
MTAATLKTLTKDRDLIMTRLIDAPPERVFEAWTRPELLKLWFAPLPWTTPIVETDVRPGGSSLIVMRSEDGSDFPYQGVYLEVVKNERLVFTNAYTTAWEPAAKPFTTVILTFEPHAGMTKYTALVRHWSVADREAHEKMGFHKGWPICAQQMADLIEVRRAP